MKYTQFLKYPVRISGINESYNDELTAIEDFVKSDIDYSGESSDIEPLLPYFVFFKFCENKRSEVTATNGEQTQIAEMTVPSVDAQIRVWNIAVEKLTAICEAKTATASKYYLSKINIL